MCNLEPEAKCEHPRLEPFFICGTESRRNGLWCVECHKTVWEIEKELKEYVGT